MKKKIAGGLVLVVLLAACACGFALSRGTTYYTQIDNSKIEKQEPEGGVIDFTGGMKYKYTLLCYDADGKGKELAFGAARELKEGAFLRLTAMPIRGVAEWEEVAYEALPAVVQAHFEAPE